ncbi:hypothetical protein ILUMI_12452, partial [Ignelater luminosus]
MAQTSNESDSFELNADTYEVIKRSAAFKKLTIKRGQLRGELTHFFNFVAEFNAKEKSIAQLKSRTSTIQPVLQDFDKTQAEIDDVLFIHDESAFDHELAQSVRESFENKFHEANDQANEIIHANAQANVSVCSDPSSNLSRPAAFDPYTKREWENPSKDMDASTFDEFIKFLAQRCKILESSAKHFDARSNCTKKNDSKTFLCSNINNKPMQSPKHKDTHCPFCKSVHAIYHCEKFKNLSVRARYDEIIRLKLCLNCLRFKHTNANCKSSGCKTCGKRHNTLLHRDSQKSAASQTNRETQGQETNSVEQISQINNHISLSQNLLHPRNRIYPLLPTALVNVYDQSNQPIVCKVLLDSGSQSYFVTYNLVKRLGLKLEPVDIPVSGINHIKTNINRMVNIDISSRYTNFKRNLTFLVVPSITEYIPFTHFNASGFNVPSGLPLADPNFYLSSAIDMLIGCDLFFELLFDGRIRLGKNMPFLQNTLLGWTVSGGISCVQNNNNSSVNVMPTSCLFTCETPIDFELQKFWVMEEIVPSRDTFLTKEELACEVHFAKTITQTSTGRFVLKMPLKPTYTQLGTTKEVAISRLLFMERKFLKDSNMKTEYTVFMSEYESLRHMTKVPCDFPESHWPSNSSIRSVTCELDSRELLEARMSTALTISVGIFTFNNIMNRCSKLTPLIRSAAYCLRFIKKMKALSKVRVQDSNNTNENYTTPDDSTETNYLTINKVEAAKIALLKIAQIQALPNELCCLQRNQEVSPSSSLKSLAPFLDSSGIMRVGGRLIHSNLSYDQKHQIIIPYSHPLTTLIINYKHRRSLHAGAQTTLSFYLRQQFWAKWSFDYLHNLQQRTKWQFSHNADLAIGAIVLLKEDNIPPLHWWLGRITAVHSGKDGVVRVVSVRTKTGVTKRALSK